eukprot:TRINITY_DN674_c0_g1_i1.p1 TRINITY_DN674_c0_g1~~TRINITY_DN674_c0_g1_i1.p1  ORF type:complete len:448 (-),score=30.36 TRINITY_DN674_c0_g1_i1:92-1435(-)
MCVRFPCVVVTAILSGIVPASGFVASFHTLPELKDRKPKLASDEVDDVDTMLKETETFAMIDEADIGSHHALYRHVFTAIPTRFQEVCGAYTLSKLECQRMISYVDGNLASGKHHKVKTNEVPLTQVLENASIAGVNGKHYDDRKEYNDYSSDFVAALNPEIGSRFLVAFGETWTYHRAAPCFPVLQKVRWADPSLRPMGNNVLLPIKYTRHFRPVFNYQKFDIPYDQKENKIIFRGGPTGGVCRKHKKKTCRERTNLVHGYYNSSDPRIDVGFSTNGSKKDSCDPSMIKGYMSFEEQLRAKFLIVAAGNDKASGLNWMLHSNSVVFMVPPLLESWLLESWLKPWKHYIPLQFDFSDLPQKLDWAIAHPKECNRIAQEGKSHVNMFVNQERDSLVRSAVLKWYSLHVDIEFVDGDAPHDDLDSCTRGTPPDQCTQGDAVPSIHSNAV